MNCVPDLDSAYLRSLTELRGVSGYETAVQEAFAARVRSVADQLIVDVLGTCIALKKSGAAGTRPHLMFVAHADEVGALVRYIAPSGLVYLTTIGRWDPELWVAQRVVVESSRGPVMGVVGRKPSHMLSSSDMSHRTDLCDMWVDLGVTSGAEAAELVAVGDPVTPLGGFQSLAGNYVAAKSLDNRAGLYAVSEAFRVAASQDKAISLAAMSSVQEEIGYRGAKAAGERCCAEIAVVVDAVHTSETPGLDPRVLGEVRLGAGPVIVRGPNFAPRVSGALRGVAGREGIPYQLAASGMATGTDANALQVSSGGNAVGLVGIPIRYMHSPAEVVSLVDIQNTVRLLVALATELGDDGKLALGE